MRKPTRGMLGSARRGKVCKVREELDRPGSECPKRQRHVQARKKGVGKPGWGMGEQVSARQWSAMMSTGDTEGLVKECRVGVNKSRQT